MPEGNARTTPEERFGRRVRDVLAVVITVAFVLGFGTVGILVQNMSALAGWACIFGVVGLALWVFRWWDGYWTKPYDE